MPKRKDLLITGETYHIMNRTVAKERIFLEEAHLQRALELLNYYRYSQLKRYSQFVQLTKQMKSKYILQVKNTSPLVDIYAFAMMPSHFHFLVRQNTKDGIKRFVSNFQNGIAKYVNLRMGRRGSLFENRFKLKFIKDNETFIHISRYIHLNPVISSLISLADLSIYPWTSFRDYIMGREELINIEKILVLFNGVERYKKFVYDNADYQKKLHKIKKILMRK